MLDKIKYNKCDKDDNVSYDEIWDNLVMSDNEVCGDDELQKGFDDVKRRIKIRKRRRVVSLGLSIGSVASIIMFVFFIMNDKVSQNAILDVKLDSYLVDMGVSKSEKEVQLYIGDSIVSNLASSAKIQSDENDNVELKSKNGKAIKLNKSMPIKIYVPAGKRFDIELSDGTRVVLNSETWFEYPSTFESETERRVKVMGEAYFDVKKDDQKHFCVEMSNGETINVLGTSFNVSSYNDNSEIITTLISGSVSYNIPSVGESIILEPNRQLKVDKATSNITKLSVDALEYVKWKDGIFYFDNEELGTIANKLSRMYGISIKVADKFTSYRFSGLIQNERGVEYIMNLISTTSDIKFAIEDGVIYLK